MARRKVGKDKNNGEKGRFLMSGAAARTGDLEEKWKNKYIIGIENMYL